MAYRIVVVPKKKRPVMRSGDALKTPYGLEVVESCQLCPVAKQRLFCDLPQDTLAGLDAISSSATYPKGALLFVEGQEPRGVFVICNGRVKLSASSADGKSLILRIAESGEVIGLPGTISGQPYEGTAEALEPVQANFVARREFLQFLREHGEATLRVAEILCHIYHATYQGIKYLGLSASAAEKLARFLLDRTGSESQNDVPIRATLTLTHEEIAEIIGTSRETVTRLFGSFKKKRLIEVHGSTLIIKSRGGLEDVVKA
jgi:CRP/FNR family transcriptional regulator